MGLKIKKLEITILLMAILCIFIGISCVSAEDLNNTNINIGDINNTASVDDTLEEIELSDFDELKRDMKNLNPGDIYYFTRDYNFTFNDNDSSNHIIEITADQIIIEGENFKINGGGENNVIFKITGDYVKIKNLQFNNFKISEEENTTDDNVINSLVQWYGNNGILFHCDFHDDTATNGGAVYWQGNKGSIQYNLFENDTALNRGGAIYITGENNNVYSNTFRNVKAPSTEVIYFSNKRNATILYVENWVDDIYSVNEMTEALCDFGCKVMRNGVDITWGSYEYLYYTITNLKPGDYFIMDNDYAIANPSKEMINNRIINIAADNVTIDGNGHIIDARKSANYFAIFNITGNNVTIKNLQIINSMANDYDYTNSDKYHLGDDYNHLTAPIEWHGDKGVIYNCTFSDNVGDFGGAIYWNANNGIIENCIFNYNAATKGGSIFVEGTNNVIRNSRFKDCYTTAYFESIYFANQNINAYGTDIPDTLILYNCTFENENPDATDIFADKGCDVLRDSINPEYIFNTSNFKELKYDLENLKDNAVYNLDKDYYVMTDIGYYAFIRANNVTINGNGRTIYGQDPLQTLFHVYGNGVKINNLNFEFSNDDFLSASFINWYGDNGALTGCVFTGAGSDCCGGALTWSGNNGIIDSCIFKENVGEYGGSIFVSGTNNTISNSVFIDCISNVDAGAIYYRAANGPGALNISNCVFESTTDEFLRSIWIDDNDSDVTVNGKAVPKTFDALYEEISNLKENDVYDIYRNYDFNTDMNCIVIATKNITIRGNGHTIYVNRVLNSSLITVKSADVKIDGLNINNTISQKGSSLITWSGNKGVLKNLILSGNIAQIGGALTWEGNNGIIDNCAFVNNMAIRFGGAIYLGGSNNNVSNSIFINSVSQLFNDAIFVDANRKNIVLENLFFDQTKLSPIVDSANIKINWNYVPDSYYSTVGEKNLNLAALICTAMVNGGLIALDDNTYYRVDYNNITGDYVLSVIINYADYDIVYQKDYVFRHVSLSMYNLVFGELTSGKYENYFIITKNLYVGDASGYGAKYGKDSTYVYEYADLVKTLNNKESGYALFSPIYDILMNDKSSSKAGSDCMSYVANIKFLETLEIKYDDPIKTKKSFFDVIYIDGNGSTISGSFADRDEDKFAEVSKGKTFGASNLTLQGFNTVIENWEGTCMFSNILFYKNKMDYWFDRDWGAAIINTGIISCTDCSFIENYAKNGGAIFNQGLLMIENCHFWGNDAYGKGDDICVGDGGSVYIDGVQITENNTHKLVCFAESMSEGLTALITLGSFVVSFTLGCIIAAFTLNPALGFAAAVAAGAAIGAAVGAVIGTATAAWLISTHYDVNYNRAKVLATLIVGDALIGAAGGMAGGYLGISATDVIDEIYFDYEYYHPLLLCGESIGTVFAGLLIGMISLL